MTKEETELVFNAVNSGLTVACYFKGSNDITTFLKQKTTDDLDDLYVAINLRGDNNHVFTILGKNGLKGMLSKHFSIKKTEEVKNEG